MLLQSWNCYTSGLLSLNFLSHSRNSFLSSRRRRRKTENLSASTTTTTTSYSYSSNSSSSSSSSSSICVCLNVGIDEIAEIAHNKVLIAAALSAAIGQLSKPFTGAILYGNGNGFFNFRSAFRAGGFPSTHSSAVVATATSLGLERGFSDVIFGLAVVYATLIMYDAQGVRREVGTHAKALNRVLLETQLNSISSSCNDSGDLINSLPGKSAFSSECIDHHPFLEEANDFKPKLLSSNKKCQSSAMISSSLPTDVDGGSEKVASYCTPLNESVGHTLAEVIAGALLGFFVSLAVYTI